MITLTIWHSPMRTALALPMSDEKLQQELVNAFGDAPQRATVADISPQALARLAIWRLKTHDAFGGTWLSDYVHNRLGGFDSYHEEPVEDMDSGISMK